MSADDNGMGDVLGFDAERLRRIQIESRSDIMQRAEGRGSLPIGGDWIPRPYEGVDA
jgi:hypothetical protein